MKFRKVSLALIASLALGSTGCGSDQAPGTQRASNGGQSGTGGSGGGVGVADSGPGRVTLRRLNGREYDNTIRDLVGLDLKPSLTVEFPADEWGDGFDNDGDVLTTSPLAIEKYLAAAELVVESTFADAAARAKVLPCVIEGATEAECAGSALGEFARRAFRRPIAADELAPYLTLVELAKSKGDTAELGLRLAFTAVLTAPDFLFLVEPDPTPSVVRALSDFELASRLSYFIWASMPDEALFQKASTGTLVQPEVIAGEVARMLADAKASAFSEVLTRQWMQTVALDFAEPDATLFPLWKETLRPSMEQELRSFLGPIVSGAAPASDLLTANYTYVNRELAEFYGLPNAATLTDTFQRVDLDVSRRGGVLRQGSFLVLTSHPDRNSPTKRGKWILDRLLCSPPEPPPADVPALDPNVPFEGTLRQRMQTLHQEAGAACAGCHAITDPMGFALENYDAIGLWREMDNGYPVDATGTMPITNVPFNGAAELTQAIAADPRFPACVAKQVLTYALGRHTTDLDRVLIDALGVEFAAGGSLLPKLVERIAQSPAMTSRQTEAL
jgi:hypothetical protein